MGRIKDFMSIEAYEEMLANSQIDAVINKAEKEFTATGELLDARDAISSLRRKHFE